MKKKHLLAALVAAAAVIIVCFVLFRRESSGQDIVVSLPTAEPVESSPAESPQGDNFADITPDTVQAAISTLSRAQSYSRTVTVKYYWPGGESSTELYSWVDGERTRIRIQLDADSENILVDGSTLYIWYDSIPAQVYSGPVTDSLEADQWLRCLSYEDLLELPTTDIFTAAYELYNGESCIYVEYDSGDLDYKNCVYISTATGLLVAAETYDATGLIYSMSAGAASLATPDEGMFIPPSLG